MGQQPIAFIADSACQGIPDAEAVAKVKARAAKFGLEFKEDDLRRLRPGPLRDQIRKEQVSKSRKGLPVGFDLYSAEEAEKQRSRSARFGTSAPPETTSGQLVEQEVARRARAEKYGIEYNPPNPEASLNKAIILEERMQLPEAAELRPDTLHVYGVDLLSTSDILSYFEQYGATYVEWVNDSSCNVLFADKFAAKRALIQLAELLPSDRLPAALQGTEAEESALQHAWYKSKVALTKQGVAVPLLLRIAASSDRKNYMAPHKSRSLWKLPVRDALAVASGKADHPATIALRKKRRERSRDMHGKRGRVDADGDAIMGEVRKVGKKSSSRRTAKHGADGSAGQEDRFLRDNERELGAGSYFLSEEGAQGRSRKGPSGGNVGELPNDKITSSNAEDNQLDPEEAGATSKSAADTDVLLREDLDTDLKLDPEDDAEMIEDYSN